MSPPSRRFMRGYYYLLASLLVLSVGFAHPAVAEDTSAAKPTLARTSITGRAGEHPDFDRIVFDWPRTVAYSVHREATKVTINFGAPGDVHFNGFSFLTRARGFNTGADANGNLTISFSVDAKSSLKDFTSGNSVAVDIVGRAVPENTGTSTPAPATPTPTTASNTAQAPAALTTPVAEAKPQPAPAAKSVAEQSAVPPKNPAPAPVATPAPAAPVAAAIPLGPSTAPAGPVSLLPVGTGVSIATTTPPHTVPPPAIKPVAQNPPTPSVAPTQPVEAKPTDVKPVTPAAAAANKPDAPALVVADTPLLVATLDPHTETRTAIWQRGGYGYLIFDKKLTLSADALTTGQQPPRVTLETLDLAKASGFRFAIPEEAVLRATREGTEWKIFLVRQEADVPVTTTLVAQPDFALGARFLLPLPDAPEPVHMTDPVIGDDLILVPLNQTQAFSVPRRMADFTILPAAQGLVIKPLTDKVIVRSVSDGVEITAEGGLHLSSSTDTGTAQQSVQKAKAAASGKSLFDFAAWGGKPDETFTETRQRLQQTVVDVPERERNRARLEFARFYFAHGYGEETSALLAWLVQQVPDLGAHADFVALNGASKILSYRADEGLRDLDSPLLTEQPEIELWQAVGQAELRNWAQAEEKFAITENILSGYPEPFYSRFMVLAIESAVAAGKDYEASDWLDRLESGPHSKAADQAIAYLHGVLHAKAGRAAAAEDAWKRVAASTDHLYKIRAELALVDLGVANGSLTPAQAADRLEALWFGWRGDDLEVDILHRLGQFYVDAKNVKAGLSTLAQAVQLYPNSPMTPHIKDEMSGIFHDVFLGDLGKSLSPLDSLTLYQQYRNLMPTGADGVAVTRNLAERLVAIDLLEQAGDLLEDLVKNKLQGTEKAHVSARLAAIRLLDHKPEAALSALELSNGEFFPADLQNERLLLRAKALADLQRDDEALSLLKDNPRESAKLLRADITMRAQHWQDAAKALLDLVGPPPKPGEVLHTDQAEWLVNAAIALSLSNDQPGLDKLAIDYGAAMAGTSEIDTFRLLTQPEKDTQLKDIAAAQSRIADVNLFQGFLDTYRKANINEEVPDKK